MLGGFDNPGGWPIQRAHRSGSWWIPSDNFLVAQQIRLYDAYKVLAVEKADPRAALSVQEKIARRGYRFFTHNCLDAVYRVLTAYGARLPDPRRREHWRPNDWFDSIRGELIPLK